MQEDNLFIVFLWQTEIQTIEYELNDTTQMKSKKLYWFWQNFCYKKACLLEPLSS